LRTPLDRHAEPARRGLDPPGPPGRRSQCAATTDYDGRLRPERSDDAASDAQRLPFRRRRRAGCGAGTRPAEHEIVATAVAIGVEELQRVAIDARAEVRPIPSAVAACPSDSEEA